MMSTSDINVTNKKTKHLLITVILVSAAILVISFLSRGLMVDPKKIPSALIGKPAHPFEIQWIQGQKHLPAAATKDSVTLDDLKGHGVVLNFWASWCVSCREEAKDFEAFWQRMKDKGIFVVGIAIHDDVENAQKFAEHYGKTYILGLDKSGRAAIDYGVTGVPETFFINKDGIVVHKETGPVTMKVLESLSKQLL